MREVMTKVYGFLRPCGPQELQKLREALKLMGDEAEGVLNLDGEIMNLGYEGCYFPLEDFLEALKPLLNQSSQGKVDYIDMEGWTLARYSIVDGLIIKSSRGLNDALSFSGH